MSFKNLFCIVFAMIIAVCCFSGCSKITQSSTSDETASSSLDLENLFTSRDLDSAYDESTSASIIMSEDNSKVTIDEEGVYIISGSCTDGQIIVDADDSDKVQLVLNNLTLSSSSSAAIYVKNADKVFITSAKDSENTLSATGEFQADGDTNIDGVIYSKDDITLNGSGTINISTNYGNGVVSKDDLKITDGTLNINVSNKGIEANDSVRIGGGTVNVNAENDAIHSDSDVAIKDGTLNIISGDDGIHADNNNYILGGTVNITKCYEAIEGTKIYISGGSITAVASDDGINASSGKDSNDAQDGRQGMGEMDSVDEDALISISGGIINIDVSGDGIDSNGSLEISGGEIYVSGPTNSGNGALDYNGSAKITGGTLVALGMSGMAQNMSEATQGSIMVNFNATYTGTITVTDSNGNEILSYKSDKYFNSIVVSSPDFKKGETYTISIGDIYQTVTLDDYIYGTGNGMGFGMK